MLIRVVLMAVLAAGLAFALLYCQTVGPYWKLTPDSTSYVLGAKSLAEGQGYREHGSPVVLFAPGTSLMFLPAWIAGGRSYFALNAEVVLFAFGALAVAFLLFRESLGPVGSGVVVLLCLGSTEYFERSTFLLSEIFYIFFSLLALYCYRRESTTCTVLASLAGLMVRTVGVSLPAAFVLDTLLVDPLGRGRKKWKFAAAYAAPLLFTFLWELRNRHLGWSYTELMVEADPWDRAGGHIPIKQLLVRLWDNRAYFRAIEDLLTNQLSRDVAWAVWPGIVLGVLIAIGFARLSLNRAPAGQSVTGIYCILFSLAVALYWPEVVIRLMVPILPVLMAYLVAGVQVLADRRWRSWLYVPAAGCLAIYLVAAYRNDLDVMAVDRAARAPGLLVSYPGNEDVERLAIWWKEHSAENEIYACQHPNVINVITGRDGVHYENPNRAGDLERAMQTRHARYLLLDLTSAADRAADQQAGSNGQFHLMREQGKARLYELAAK